MARAALEVATRYSDRRYAFGEKIRVFQGVNFKIAEAITLLDAARAITHAAGKAADQALPTARRLVSEAKKFATDACWQVCNFAMEIVGGIGYTNVFPIEKLVRDARLIQIWTGTNDVMKMLIQHEYIHETLDDPDPGRIPEEDAEECDLVDEKVYRDDEMWTKGW
jgi:alkylation response protein AidB-like acyl-CoA dehydrogenase